MSLFKSTSVTDSSNQIQQELLLRVRKVVFISKVTGNCPSCVIQCAYLQTVTSESRDMLDCKIDKTPVKLT